MSILDVGARCAHPLCSTVDFLPTVCRCGAHYCQAHIDPDSHSCPFDNVALPFDNDNVQTLRRCAMLDCHKPTLGMNNLSEQPTIACSHCQRSFCSEHRHPEQHQCMSLSQKSGSALQSAARKLLAQHFPAATSQKNKSLASKNVTLSNPVGLPRVRKAELIKLRHRAVPGNPREPSTPLDERSFIIFHAGTTEKLFWFRKTTVVGKVLDCLASQSGIHLSATSSMQLVCDRDNHVLRNDRPLGEEVQDGDTLRIERY